MNKTSQNRQWAIAPGEIFGMGPVIPVLVIHKEDDAIPVATALLEGGLSVLEVTLRTPSALAAIRRIARELPEALVGAGTVTNARHLQEALAAGARFLISPGLTPNLLAAANTADMPLIPGIATISELMTGLDYGFDHFKFFPAEASGGPKALKAIAGPFPNIRFCPTGGITADNMMSYLKLNNVDCVGASWLVTQELVAAGDWKEITRRTRQVLQQTGYDFE
ncbi:MAG: bifunctional 4-hydroxy-2-oxoglutarate aldolase/2-dehydro-3-deoxy-phosphogluconate aldolase [Pseudomonadales bacterium]|nr:bifunctional 4-hydroxy-2-oxoglutarate aldolase/2-dehydro-3-deoxy-phosphogluconate aldolase [Pseudomonadales bacterium]